MKTSWAASKGPNEEEKEVDESVDEGDGFPLLPMMTGMGTAAEEAEKDAAAGRRRIWQRLRRQT